MTETTKIVSVEQALAWMLSRYWFPVDERCGAPLAWLLARGTPVSIRALYELEVSAADRLWALTHPRLMPEPLRLELAGELAIRAMTPRERHPDLWQASVEAAEAAALEAGADFEADAGPAYAHLAGPARAEGRNVERQWQLEHVFQRLAGRVDVDVVQLELRALLLWCLAKYLPEGVAQSGRIDAEIGARQALTAAEILELESLPAADRIRAVVSSELLPDSALWELACDFADHVQRVTDAGRPGAPFPERCLSVARRFARGEALWAERTATLEILTGAEWAPVLRPGDLKAAASGPPNGLEAWKFAARSAAWTLACEVARVAAWRSSWDAVQAAYHATDEKLDETGRGGWAPQEMAQAEWRWQLSTIREKLEA